MRTMEYHIFFANPYSFQRSTFQNMAVLGKEKSLLEKWGGGAIFEMMVRLKKFSFVCGLVGCIL